MEHHAVAQPVSPRAQRGFTLLEVLIGLAIFSIVSGSVYVGYGGIVDIVTKTQQSSAAVSIIESRVEMVRNMRYEDVGVVGGVPAGILAQVEEVTLGGQSFTITTTVRNIDNPFDGTVTGNPLDLNPADYKLVQFDMSCAACGQYGTASMVSYVAPKTLEDESRNGSIEISVIDASGQPVPQASVHIVNAAASVNLTTTTNNDGKLLLLSVATGSAAYEITASKTGYSTDQTYPPDNPANALKPHATIASQQLTLQTMVIDRVSTLTGQTHDRFCNASGPFEFQLTGEKLIGIMPDVPKYSEEQTVTGAGSYSQSGLEWDAYHLTPTDTSLNIAGIQGDLTLTLDPASSGAFEWVVVPTSQSAVLVTVTDQVSGEKLNGATVAVTGTSYAVSQYSGHWTVTDTDWSIEPFTDASVHMDTTSEGILTLELENGVYATGSTETLTSRTFDLGTTDVTLRSIDWNPATQPDDTVVRFQLAGNTDNTTWDFVGPDGTAASYFDAPGQSTPSSLNGKRYFRYRTFMETTDASATPSIEDVGITYASSCLTDGDAYFNGLTSGASYTLTIDAPGYTQSTQTFTAPASWTQISVPLTPQ